MDCINRLGVLEAELRYALADYGPSVANEVIARILGVLLSGAAEASVRQPDGENQLVAIDLPAILELPLIAVIEAVFARPAFLDATPSLSG